MNLENYLLQPVPTIPKAEPKVDTTKPVRSYDMWERFHGAGSGSITDDELRELFKLTKQALPWLEANRSTVGSLAIREALHTMSRLAGYAQARGMRGNWSLR